MFIVVNAKKEIKAKYIQYSRVIHEVDDILVGLSFNDPRFIEPYSKQRKEEVHEMVDALVEERKYTATTSGYNNWKEKYNFTKGIGSGSSTNSLDLYGYDSTEDFNFADDPSDFTDEDFGFDDYMADYSRPPVRVINDKSTENKVSPAMLVDILAKSIYDEMGKQATLLDYVYNEFYEEANNNINRVLDHVIKTLENVNPDLTRPTAVKFFQEIMDEEFDPLELIDSSRHQDMIDAIKTFMASKEARKMEYRTDKTDFVEAEGTWWDEYFNLAESLVTALTDGVALTMFINGLVEEYNYTPKKSQLVIEELMGKDLVSTPFNYREIELIRGMLINKDKVFSLKSVLGMFGGF